MTNLPMHNSWPLVCLSKDQNSFYVKLCVSVRSPSSKGFKSPQQPLKSIKLSSVARQQTGNRWHFCGETASEFLSRFWPVTMFFFLGYKFPMNSELSVTLSCEFDHYIILYQSAFMSLLACQRSRLKLVLENFSLMRQQLKLFFIAHFIHTDKIWALMSFSLLFHLLLF